MQCACYDWALKNKGAVFFTAHMLVQEDLATLQKRDPEFFAYLQQTDNDLLNFSLPSGGDVAAEEEAEEADDQQDEVQLFGRNVSSALVALDCHIITYLIEARTL